MKRILALLLVLCLLCTVSAASASGGSSADPIVTRSYLEESYQPSILDQADKLIDQRFEELKEGFLSSLNARSSTGAIYAALLHQAGYTIDLSYGMGGYAAQYDDVYALALGTMVSVESGDAMLEAGPGILIDITEGTECDPGQLLEPGHSYLSAGEMTAAIRILSQDAALALTGNFAYLGMNPPEASQEETGEYQVRYTRYADALRTMGLFLGTDQGYELHRAATRIEGLVMLIRLLGEEDAALACTDSHPFRDVPAWAKNYVAYAYKMGYTKGTSTRYFSPNDAIDAAQYCTFLLRALGYEDSQGDFLWSEADETARDIGIITAAEQRGFSARFYRDHVAYTSYRALSAYLKNENIQLIEKLINTGAVDPQDYQNAGI